MAKLTISLSLPLIYTS